MPSFTLDETLSATCGELFGERTDVFADITTDTRKILPGSLFVALKGERFDGEDFARDAAQKGAAGVMVSASCPAEKTAGLATVIKVADTLGAYQALAHLHRERFAVPVAAVTGSNGKTTTKDLTAAALSSLGEILKTEANFNNEIGLPLTLLKLNENHKAAVVEIGMRGKGQIASLAPIARPTVGIITNVGSVHIELLGSMENIAEAKSELAAALEAGSVLILNADDPRVIAMRDKAKSGVKTITYGIENDADVRGEAIRSENDATKFMVRHKNERHEYEIPMLGKHNVYNALAAIAVAVSTGLRPHEINEGFKRLQKSKMRFEISEKNGCKIINDAYNASPLSMTAAINTVSDMTKGRKIAVLGDMLELGDTAKQAHEDIGRLLAKKDFAFLIVYGELAKNIASAAENIASYAAESHEDAARKLREIAIAGDTILFKGSRGMTMEKIIELF